MKIQWHKVYKESAENLTPSRYSMSFLPFNICLLAQFQLLKVASGYRELRTHIFPEPWRIGLAESLGFSMELSISRSILLISSDLMSEKILIILKWIHKQCITTNILPLVGRLWLFIYDYVWYVCLWNRCSDLLKTVIGHEKFWSVPIFDWLFSLNLFLTIIFNTV